MADFPEKSDRTLFVQQVRVRIRRLMREGFREFLISMALAAIGTICVDVYIRSKVALDEAMRDETAKIVGSREEPTDSIRELGLVATALAKVNSAPSLPGSECSAAEPSCVSFERFKKLVGDFVQSADAEIATAAAKHLSPEGDWINPNGEIKNLAPQRESVDEVSWPELTDSSFCYVGPDHTFLMVPAQMRTTSDPPFSARLAAAADVSGSLVRFKRLADFLKNPEYAKLAESVVQAYFISPDSLLRIWNPVHADLCRGRFRFPKTRLWASKNYFVQFLEVGIFG